MRHACFLFDTPETHHFIGEIRQALCGALFSIAVDLRVGAAGGGAIATALGTQVLRDAVENGMLSPDDLKAAMAADAAEDGAKRVPGHMARALAMATQRRLSNAILFDKAYQDWRDRWHVESGMQPAINFVKLLDGHWKAITVAHAKMVDLTTAAFPLHFVQISRVMWFVAMIALPWDWAADLGVFGTALAQAVFSMAYFSAERVAVDMESPYGGHVHAVPLAEMLARFEASSRAVLRNCAQGCAKSNNTGDGDGDDDDGSSGGARVFNVLETLEPLGSLDAMVTARARKLQLKEAARKKRRKTVLMQRQSALAGEDPVKATKEEAAAASTTAAAVSSSSSSSSWLRRTSAKKKGEKGDIESGGGVGSSTYKKYDDDDDGFVEEYALEYLGEEPVPLQPENATIAIANITWNLNEKMPEKSDVAALFDEIFDRHALGGGKETATTPTRRKSKMSMSLTKKKKNEKATDETGGQPPVRVVAVAAQEACPISITKLTFSKQVAEWTGQCSEVLGLRDFLPLVSTACAATTLTVFVHKSLFRAVSSVESDAVACGAGGVLCNKGAAAACLHLHGSKICFLSAHLAAQQEQTAKRHADQRRICSCIFNHPGLHPAYRVMQPQSAIPDLRRGKASPPPPPPRTTTTTMETLPPPGEEQEKPLLGSESGSTSPELAVAAFDAPDNARIVRMFDAVFFLGDLNYRIDSTRGNVEAKIASAFDDGGVNEADIEWLRARDQLSKARDAGTAFRGFEEGKIRFRPTFVSNFLSAVVLKLP